MTTDRRSAAAAAQQLGLWPGFDVPAFRPLDPPGVGGRRARNRAPRGGGGYLNGRTASELRADPRFRELAEIGLRSHWMRVAELIGYDNFVAMWAMLSGDHALRDEDGLILLSMPDFRRYQRYQRNRYIETLVAAGFRHSGIHAMLEAELNEQLSLRHTRRLAEQSAKKLKAERAASAHQYRRSNSPPDKVTP